MSKKLFSLIAVAAILMVALAACAPAAPQVVEVQVTSIVEKPVEVVVTAVPEAKGPLKVFGAFATPIEEPWDGVIHAALQKAASEGKIEYTYTEAIGYSGDMERVLREVCDQQKPDLILGDAFGNEEAVRRVAVDYPEIAFAFGSGGGPAEPNFAVFDNWIHEPAYLCGMIAAGVTKTGRIGVVGGHPVAEVNRIVNAFIDGAKSINPDVKVSVTFINSWYDPAAAKEAALAQVDAGADVLFAERFGVIEAAVENKLFAFGNMSDQYELGPDHVLTGPVWNMTPTVEYVIKQVAAGAFTAQDLKDFSMVAKGGAYLADFHGMDSKIPAEVLAKVKEVEASIKNGTFRVDIKENTPISE